jgi:hypothetical protein
MTNMKTEELFKKLEGLEYPDVEVAGHKRRLKTALLSSSTFSRQTAGSRDDNLTRLRRVLVPAGIVVLVALLMIWRAGSVDHNPGQANIAGKTQLLPEGQSSPLLTVIEPMDNATVATRVISVEGITEPGAVVSVNDEIAIADEDGNFSVDIGLDAGINVINIAVSDSSGAQSTTTIVANLVEGV